jgi:PTS system fructose-specific IIC component
LAEHDSPKIVLEPRNLLFDIGVGTKAELIRLMVERLVLSHYVKDAEKVIAAVLDREATRPTGLARGVACPHAKSPFVSALGIALARLATPLDFGALDGVKARHIFLIVSPKSAESGPHIAVLSSVVRCYQKVELLQALDAAASAGEYLDRLKACNDA